MYEVDDDQECENDDIKRIIEQGVVGIHKNSSIPCQGFAEKTGTEKNPCQEKLYSANKTKIVYARLEGEKISFGC